MPIGTTSACAENTGSTGSILVNPRNYLRVRGEYRSATIIKVQEVELPPRARRILSPSLPNPVDNGTTSACAENTTPGPAKTGEARNYLRVRGEYNG